MPSAAALETCALVGVSPAAAASHIDEAIAEVVERHKKRKGEAVQENVAEGFAEEAWDIACEKCAWLRGNEFDRVKMAPLVHRTVALLELSVCV